MTKFTIFYFFGTLMVGSLCYHWESEELECLKEQSLKKALIEEALDTPGKPIPEDDETVTKFLECSWGKQGYLEKDGEINWDKVVEVIEDLKTEDLDQNKSNPDDQEATKLTAAIMKAIVDECQEKFLRGETHGQTVAKIQNCLDDEMKKVIKEIEDL